MVVDKKLSTIILLYLPLFVSFSLFLFDFGKKICYIWRRLKKQMNILSNGVKEEPAFDSWQTGYRWTQG